MSNKLEQTSEEHYKTTPYQLTCCFLPWISQDLFMSCHCKGFLKKLSGSDSWYTSCGYREMMHSQSPSDSVFAARKMVRISWWTQQLLPLFFLLTYPKYRTIPSTMCKSHQIVKQHCCSPWSRALFSDGIAFAFAILWKVCQKGSKCELWHAWRPVNDLKVDLKSTKLSHNVMIESRNRICNGTDPIMFFLGQL